MISILNGVVLEIDGPIVVMDVNGVGYEVHCSWNAISQLKVGKKSKLIVYTDVREDSINLFGFEDKLEKQVFLLLTRVKGVGSKSAADILSRVDKVELLRIIGSQDTTKLCSVKGIGKKTAERIIIELRDRVAEFSVGGLEGAIQVDRDSSGGFEDAILALVSLGINRKSAEQAVLKVGSEKDLDTSGLIKEALRYI